MKRARDVLHPLPKLGPPVGAAVWGAEVPVPTGMGNKDQSPSQGLDRAAATHRDPCLDLLVGSVHSAPGIVSTSPSCHRMFVSLQDHRSLLPYSVCALNLKRAQSVCHVP